MIRRYFFRNALTLGIIAASVAVAAQKVNLPTIKMQGKEYYFYKVKKGESAYGLCKRYGWNEDTLRAMNTNMGTKVEKGRTIYYPTTAGSSETPVIGKIDRVKVSPQPIVHKVNRGETVYSISKLYNVPVELIYSSNPDARHGVKAGQTLTIVQTVEESSKDSSPFYYTVQNGETLADVAKNYNTDVQSIMNENPGMSERSLTSGDNIRVVPNNRSVNRVTESREVPTVSGFTPYKIAKNDTWESISAATGVSIDDLQTANDTQVLPKKGSWIVIPQITNQVKKAIVETPVMAESTVSERDEIYRTVHNIDKDNSVNVAVVLEKPSLKSNTDFVRGFLMGVDNLKSSGSKIHMNVIDASAGQFSQSSDSILNASNLIIGVYESDFPEHLGNIGRANGAEVVNVLDTKSDLFESNASVIQVLQPIDYFNDLTVNYIHDKYPGSQLILLGDIDTGDRFADILTDVYAPDVTTRMSVEEFSVYPFNPSEDYVVYCYPLKKDEISEALTAISLAQDAGVDIIPIGRAQWVAYAQPLSEIYGKTGVIVPSRVYANPFDAKQKEFNERFRTIYHTAPVTSFPQYAMLGYDIANCFIPTTAANGGDYNTGLRLRPGLQNDIELRRLNNWSGFINTNGYILRYLPAEIVEKIEIQ